MFITWVECLSNGTGTYGLDLAGKEGEDVGDDDEGGTDDQSHGGAKVELVGPQGQKEVVGDVGRVVRVDSIGGDSEDRDSHEQGQDGDTHADRVHSPEGLDLRLQVKVLGINLELRARHFTLLGSGHLGCGMKVVNHGVEETT